MFKISFKTQKEIIIEASKKEVFSFLNDFNSWPKWSPWFCQEPKSKYSVVGQPGELGHSQNWNGERIGSGNINIEKIEENAIFYQLNFLKPWKSAAKTHFNLEEINSNKTKVIWHMDGNLPFFMFFMKKMMVAFIGMDYQRGLIMLKELIETGKVTSKTTLEGKIEQEGFHYIGIERECSIDEMPKFMGSDFTKLHKMLEEGKLPKYDMCISIYPKYDMVKKEAGYIAALAYKEPIELKIDELVSGHIPKHQSLKTTHLGNYMHLGNAWTTAMGAVRHFKYKCLKGVYPYEVYVNDPNQTPGKELITEVYIPLKS